ncbi:MAG: hypothetical protein ACOYON_08415 [Fimbriimonas sp.]
MKNLGILFLALLALGVVGCSGADGDLGTKGGEAGSTYSPESEIKRIEEDKHMPQAAKDAAIGQIKARMEAGKAMGDSMQKSKEKEKGG